MSKQNKSPSIPYIHAIVIILGIVIPWGIFFIVFRNSMNDQNVVVFVIIIIVFQFIWIRVSSYLISKFRKK
jgi:uncharacterized membrane protein YdbT with pleckstrin-like domain